MIVSSLIIKISQLFLYMLFGYILAKTRVLNDENSSALSKISLYLLLPAALINSFDVKLTEELSKGLAISFAAAFVIHILFFAIDRIYTKITKARSVERASILYTNAGNIIIPIVIATIGEEWVVYVSCFIIVQQFFIWTHAIRLFDDNGKFNIKKIILNVNIIAIAIGFILLLSGIRLPVFFKDITTSLSGMLGPVGMIIAGILIPKVNIRKTFADIRIYRVLIMRMVVCSFMATIVLKFGAQLINIPYSHNLLMVSLFSSVSPTAATILQFSQLYNKEPEFAVSVNVATTLMCILTMPLMIIIYSI